MDLWIGVADPAGQLPQWAMCVEETELVEVIFTVLYFHLIKMDAATVEAHGCASLHPRSSDAVMRDAFGEPCHGRLRDSSSGE